MSETKPDMFVFNSIKRKSEIKELLGYAMDTSLNETDRQEAYKVAMELLQEEWTTDSVNRHKPWHKRNRTTQLRMKS